MNEILKKISEIGIVPVIKIEDIDNAVPLAKALIDGGLPVAEVTFRAANADKAIKLMREAYPQMIVGAGTVLNAEQVDAAAKAGAQFIVSPGFNVKTVEYCKSIGMPITPGTSTASEIELAIEEGLDVVKFFPAEQSGGLSKIKALGGPYTNMKFMPTGGIDLKNLVSYMNYDKIIACGGSFMVKSDFINNKEWDKVTSLCKQAVDLMLGFEIGHVGINAANESEALNTANFIASLFNMTVKNGNSSIMAGSAVEVMKSPYLGKNGHIGIKTNSVARAKYHLESRGIKFNDATAKYDAKGNMKAVYVADEIAGFAIHLMQK